jgi:hypothetical protein
MLLCEAIYSVHGNRTVSNCSAHIIGSTIHGEPHGRFSGLKDSDMGREGGLDPERRVTLSVLAEIRKSSTVQRSYPSPDPMNRPGTGDGAAVAPAFQIVRAIAAKLPS